MTTIVYWKTDPPNPPIPERFPDLLPSFDVEADPVTFCLLDSVSACLTDDYVLSDAAQIVIEP